METNLTVRREYTPADIKHSYSLAEVREIQENTGYLITLPEQFSEFSNAIKAIYKLKQTPNYYNIIKVNNISDILKSDRSLTIINIKKLCGLTYCQSVLSIAIIDLCDFFNITKNMNVEQIGQTINMLIDDYPLNTLTIADIKLCFNRIKAGKYGKIYDRMDGGVIMDALNEYWNERMQLADDMQYNEHLSNKGNGFVWEALEHEAAEAEKESIQEAKKIIINKMREK